MGWGEGIREPRLRSESLKREVRRCSVMPQNFRHIVYPKRLLVTMTISNRLYLNLSLYFLYISDVRIHPNLNKYVWSNGVKSIAKRIRVRLSRKRNDDEDAKEKLYTLVEHVPGPVKGLETTICED